LFADELAPKAGVSQLRANKLMKEQYFLEGGVAVRVNP